MSKSINLNLTDALRRHVDARASDDDVYATPAEVAGSSTVHVGRIREDTGAEQGLAMWVAFDAVVKGSALNAVAVAELLVRDYL